MIACVCNIFDRANDLLPHYFRHYSALGVEKFFFGIYGPVDGPLWKAVLEHGKGLDISIEKMLCSTGFNVEHDGAFKTWVGESLEGGSWIIPTDLDEFHDIGKYKTFQELRVACEEEHADFVPSATTDRITKDGSIPRTIDPTISIWEQFPLDAPLTRDVVKGYCRKLCMVKAGIPIWGGHHDLNRTDYKVFSTMMKTYHFKWWGELREREKRKLEIYTEIGFKWRTECERVIAYLDANGGTLKNPIG